MKKFFLILLVIITFFTACLTYADSQEVSSPEKEDIAFPYFETGSDVHTYRGFTLHYSEEHEQALWVAYLLTDEEVAGTIGRTNNFHADKNIETKSAALSDYSGSEFDRGHLAPAADMKWCLYAMKESFLMSNMSPQAPGFNRGIWKKLEKWVRDQAEHDVELYVVTGPILTDGPYDTIGTNEVSIPKQYFKVILDYKGPDIKAIGFLLPHESSQAELSSFVVSIDHIESISGLDFFHLLEDTLEASLESSADFKEWN
jgi:endonuclease G, mitochondrial